jgi:hypothetical protein
MDLVGGGVRRASPLAWLATGFAILPERLTMCDNARQCIDGRRKIGERRPALANAIGIQADWSQSEHVRSAMTMNFDNLRNISQ